MGEDFQVVLIIKYISLFKRNSRKTRSNVHRDDAEETRITGIIRDKGMLIGEANRKVE